MLFEQAHQQRLRGPGVGDELGGRHRRQVGTVRSHGDGLGLGVVELLPGAGGQHPAEMRADGLGELGPDVVGMLDVGRHVGVVAEERHVELFDGDRRAAHALHPDVGEVDVEVAAEEPAGLGALVGHLTGGDEALADIAVAPTETDPLVPGERLAERAGRGRQHLTGIGAGVVRPARARRPVGDPAVFHVCSRCVVDGDSIRGAGYRWSARRRPLMTSSPAVVAACPRRMAVGVLGRRSACQPPMGAVRATDPSRRWARER